MALRWMCTGLNAINNVVSKMAARDTKAGAPLAIEGTVFPVINVDLPQEKKYVAKINDWTAASTFQDKNLECPAGHEYEITYIFKQATTGVISLGVCTTPSLVRDYIFSAQTAEVRLSGINITLKEGEFISNSRAGDAGDGTKLLAFCYIDRLLT